jgi:DtxR family transcriptional regulator, Mn-dependent transcriptional regulator
MHAVVVREALTRSVEDYLKAIYGLSPAGRPAATSDIAQQLDLSAPSVSGMLKRLADQGLVEHEPYKGVQLTDEGRRVALRMIRRHRIIEAYLVGTLGYTWDTVHDEAERLEHAVSDTLIERMASALGNPGFDPHGDPIPGSDGSVAEQIVTPLNEIEAGESVAIRRVRAGDPERLRYLASFNLRPGVQVTVVSRQPFQGPITLRVGGWQFTIGHELGQLLLCEREAGR